MAHLRLFMGNRACRVELSEPSCTIGRSPKCTLVLDNHSVSREHARISRRDDGFLIEDAGSRNKTYVNGRPIDVPTVLGDNDIIRICNFHIIFVLDSTEDSSRHNVVLAEGADDFTRIRAAHTPSGADSDLGLVETARPREKLEAVVEINRTIVAVLRLEELMNRVLDCLFKIFPQSNRGYILLRGPAGADALPRAVKHRPGTDDASIRFSRTVLRQVLDNGQALLAEDAYRDPQLGSNRSISDNFIRSIMCVPLMTGGELPFGAIWLHSESMREPFDGDDLDLLVSIAGMVAVAITRAQMHHDLLKQDRLKNEVHTGRMIQQAFLPMDWPFVPHYGFYANYEPAQSVGGDHYGFVRLPDNRMVITIGDIAGKGLPAALLMARLSSEVRFVAINNPDAAQAVRALNRIIQDNWPSDRFVSLLYMLLDLDQDTLAIVNAGHVAPLFRGADGRVECIASEPTGPPLNTDTGFDYESRTLLLKQGGTLLAYTDGVTEARNPAGEPFGIERLTRAFEHAPADPSAAGDAVIREVRRFVAGGTPSDDVALICLGRQSD